MTSPQLLPELFRTEYGKIVAVLVRSFGFAHVSAAEDIASDTFLLAAETWGRKGLPPSPTAWLYTVARNKATDLRRREATFRDKVHPALKAPTVTEPDFSTAGFQDSQLRMIFALCHPQIPQATQVALCLRILGGFGIDQIAVAFLTKKATINKRLTRGKGRLRALGLRTELPPPGQLVERLAGVLTTLYLLFNEGYYSSVTDTDLRQDLCADAMRLTLLLTEYPPTDRPEVNAVLALMCFQTSRFHARLTDNGEPIEYDLQDRSRWDDRLITQGRHFLERATPNGEMGRFQLEAAIAFLHTQPAESEEKWPTILQLYNRLLQIRYSPVVALNRTYAYYRVNGPEAALTAARNIGLEQHVGYQLLLAELYTALADTDKARQAWENGLFLTRNPGIRTVIQRKIVALKKGEH